jgi:tetratricopeptide (TPR) repeat protein
MLRKEYSKASKKLKTLLKDFSFKEGWVNLGGCYKELKEWNLSKECFIKALETPYANGEVERDSISLHNLGALEYICCNDAEARQWFSEAMRVNPDNLEAKWNYGTTGIRMFTDGKDVNFLEAWFYYDTRFRLYDLSVMDSHELWDFRSSWPNEDIVVLRDQGFGDTLMFARYISELEKYFRRVYVQCLPEMAGLFKYVYVGGEGIRFAAPICSLGKLLDYIPSGEWLAGKWLAKGDGIGCVWQGSTGHPNDMNRSCPAHYFDSLEGDKYTLAPGESRNGYTHLNGSNWLDTIENLKKLKLVITVDTAIAHLCGSLGMPCWVLMPLTYSDYRWGTHTDKCAWYDSVRVIRNPGSWDKVFAKVKERLNEENN